MSKSGIKFGNSSFESFVPGIVCISESTLRRMLADTQLFCQEMGIGNDFYMAISADKGLIPEQLYINIVPHNEDNIMYRITCNQYGNPIKKEKGTFDPHKLILVKDVVFEGDMIFEEIR